MHKMYSTVLTLKPLFRCAPGALADARDDSNGWGEIESCEMCSSEVKPPSQIVG